MRRRQFLLALVITGIHSSAVCADVPKWTPPRKIEITFDQESNRFDIVKGEIHAAADRVETALTGSRDGILRGTISLRGNVSGSRETQNTFFTAHRILIHPESGSFQFFGHPDSGVPVSLLRKGVDGKIVSRTQATRIHINLPRNQLSIDGTKDPKGNPKR